jgi:hypothetical protein
MDRRDRACLDDLTWGSALDFSEQWPPARGLAVPQSGRTLRIEPKHPVAHRLKPDPADLSGISPRTPVINRRQG